MDTGIKFECVNRYCYLGDMIGADGGAELASRRRVIFTWSKFRELLSILTTKGASMKLTGKICKVYVRSVKIYGSETWAMKYLSIEDRQ